MTTENWLQVEHLGDGVTQVTLARGPVNALTPEFLSDFADLLDRLENDPQTKAVVLASALKVFSAGLDLKEAMHFDLDQQNAIVKGLNVTFARLYGFPKPTIIAVNGAAIAGGLFFVLASDHRVADERAVFGLAEIRVGADFPVGPLEIARDALTPADLRRLTLSGKPMKAEQALAAGIVDRLAQGPEVLELARKAAQDFATIPPKTFASVKQQTRGPALGVIDAAMKNGANAPKGGWYNDETRAAMAAMIG